MDHPHTQECLLAVGAIHAMAALAARHLPPRAPWLLVHDEATWRAAGALVAQALAEQPMEHHSLGTAPHATMAHARAVMEAARGCGGLVAIGSGTVNDITKYAAAQLGVPYLCVATAASMNGYCSATASLEDGGFKHSYPARAPRAVVADLAVIAAAPPRLAAAGLGDTLCRTTVEADMLLAHHLLGTPYPAEAFARLRAREPALLSGMGRDALGDASFLQTLMEVLLESGAIMAEYGTSATASQGEHMIAHTAELLYPEPLASAMHGEMIAVTTLTMVRLQERLRALDMPQLRPLPYDHAESERMFGHALADGFMQAYAKKQLSVAHAAQINNHLHRHWPDIRAALEAVMTPAERLAQRFQQVGMPHTPADIGLSDAEYARAVASAHMTRERFGFLDIAAMQA